MERETQSKQDERVERLWRTLDTRKEGQLDLNGLKKGLKKMDHRTLNARIFGLCLLTAATALKNADGLLRDVLKAVDTNGDGRIQYNGTIHESSPIITNDGGDQIVKLIVSYQSFDPSLSTPKGSSGSSSTALIETTTVNLTRASYKQRSEEHI